MSNLFGVSIIGYIFTIVAIVVNPRWKRQPLSEEDLLQPLGADD